MVVLGDLLLRRKARVLNIQASIWVQAAFVNTGFRLELFNFEKTARFALAAFFPEVRDEIHVKHLVALLDLWLLITGSTVVHVQALIR